MTKNAIRKIADDDQPQLLYGAEAIAALINQTPRQVYHAAAKGQIPGLFQQGKRLVLDKVIWREGIRARAVR